MDSRTSPENDHPPTPDRGTTTIDPLSEASELLAEAEERVASAKRLLDDSDRRIATNLQMLDEASELLDDAGRRGAALLGQPGEHHEQWAQIEGQFARADSLMEAVRRQPADKVDVVATVEREHRRVRALHAMVEGKLKESNSLVAALGRHAGLGEPGEGATTPRPVTGSGVRPRGMPKTGRKRPQRGEIGRN